MKVAVIDAQGAGIGQSVIKKIRKEIADNLYIVALGTNSCATSNMVRAGANVGITGEKAIVAFCKNNALDAIIAPIGALYSGGINGEITASISKAILDLESIKYIMPLQKHGIYIPGTRNLQIKDIIDEIVFDIKGRL
jgi:hypothetical protein